MASRLNGHELEQILGDNEGQGSLVCCSPRGCKESDTTMTEQQLVAQTVKNLLANAEFSPWSGKLPHTMGKLSLCLTTAEVCAP